MRHSFLAILVILLSVCLVAMWAHRFAPMDGAGRVGVDSMVELGEPSPQFERGKDGWVMRHAAGGAPAIALFGIPGAEAAGHLHIRFQARAAGLIPGAEPWSDGRLFIEWVDPRAGGVVGVSTIHSARGDDGCGIQELVAHAPRKGVLPRVRVEHLGVGGRYEVAMLDMTPARERAVWRVGRWVILLGMVAALAALVRSTKKPAHWRGLLAAGIWVWVAVNYVVPGPWDSARPFGVAFAFPEVREIQGGVGTNVAPVTFFEVKKLPEPESMGLRLKRWLPWLRPLLHAALLFGPVWIGAWCVGRRGGLILGLSLSLAIEAAQVMFGFGFGWDDIGDLFFNSIGIAGALWVHWKFAWRLHSWLPLPFPEPDLTPIATEANEKAL